MRLIVSGSRTITNYELVKQILDHYLKNVTEEIEIVNGDHWEGVDVLAKRYAKEKGYALKLIPANWKKFGKPAGPLRNQEMADYGTHCICIWDGESTGTYDMYTRAMDKGLPTRLKKVA